ncbi:MAG TPA: Xaa-Pro dipeptidase [Planctomycetota bacterium]|nr:Xaa-Pro dipeptidase [Planctomycetota bacterium]
MIAGLYGAHVEERRRRAEAACAAAGFDGMVIHSGSPFTYYADDQDAPFRRTPHFAAWTPLAGPHHLLHVRPGAKPVLVRVAPEDYWYEQAPLGTPYWAEAFEIRETPDAAAAWKELKLSARTAYVGDAPDAARAAGVAEAAINPKELLARLDWDRSYKTPYEVACLEAATRKAARGHLAAKAAFLGGASELEIHHAYVVAAGCVDHELPYGSIVALDEKGAILHYENKRSTRNGRVLLIDAGALEAGYGSDITRTWTTHDCDPTFVALVEGVDRLQLELCRRVKPGLKYLDLHHAAHGMIADLLHELGVLKKGGAAALEAGLTLPFFPHGLGHFLGIQVHDVAGRQTASEGGVTPPPAHYPYLRTTRVVEPGMCFTVEPGVYFIPMLLRAYRSGPKADLIDWSLVDRLTPCGGVRIEDNLVVTADGHRNLTRPCI